MINYKPLVNTLEKKGISIYALQRELNNADFRKTINARKYISTETLDHICCFLKCRVEDVIEYEDGPQNSTELKNNVYIIMDWGKIKDLLFEEHMKLSDLSLKMGKSRTYLNTLARQKHVGSVVAYAIAKAMNVDLYKIGMLDVPSNTEEHNNDD